MSFPIDSILAEYTRLSKELSDLYHALAREAGLSDSALDILYALCVLGDGCLQRDVCELSFTSKQTIHSSIRKLEREGLLYLQPGRGRDMHIRLTEEGRQLVRARIQPIRDIERRAMEALTPEEQRAFLHLTRNYLSSFRSQVHQGGSQ